MSQHDLDLANANGAAIRSDMNAALQALATLQSGSTAPTSPLPLSFWADTLTNVLKLRNAANTGWVSLLSLSTGATDSAASTFVGQAGDVTNVQDALFKVVGVTETQAKARTYYEGQRVYITDRGALYKFTASRNLIAGQAQSEITFDDTLHVLVTAGGMLQFADWGAVRQRQAINRAKLAGKIKDRTSTITIACYGDSITYGQAQPGSAGATNRIGAATGFGDGSTYEHWQFNSNYPVVLNAYLTANILQICAVSNLGYSGDRAITGYLRHRTVTSADAVTIMYGVNDCLYATSNGATPAGLTNVGLYSVQSYTTALRLFAAKQVLQGKAVTILGTAPFGSLVGFDGTQFSAFKLTRAYNAAAKAVADEFGCRFVDVAQDVFQQYGLPEITDEGTHLNIAGLKIAGERIAAALVTVETENRVSHGSVLIANPNGVALLSRNGVNVLSNSTSTTPRGTPDNERTCVLAGSELISLPFYAETSGLVLFVNGLTSASGAVFEISLDRGALQSDFHFQHAYLSGKPTAQKNVTASGIFNRDNINLSDDSLAFLHVANSGWHTLSIKKVSGTSAVLFDSISFESVESVLASDVYGTTAKASYSGGALQTDQRRNIATITNPSTGTFAVTFAAPMANTKYSVGLDVTTGFLGNMYRVSSKTVNGFTLEFMGGAGSGVGIAFSLYNPTGFDLVVTGGR
jgi:lysophospholipase L1-like esterase